MEAVYRRSSAALARPPVGTGGRKKEFEQHRSSTKTLGIGMFACVAAPLPIGASRHSPFYFFLLGDLGVLGVSNSNFLLRPCRAIPREFRTKP